MSENINLKQEISNKFSLQVKLLSEFNKSILSNTFRVNLKALIDNSDIISFDKHNQWEGDPYKFCYDHYGLSEYYKVILLVNNCRTMFDFTSTNLNRKIIAPRQQIIESVLSYSSN